MLLSSFFLKIYLNITEFLLRPFKNLTLSFIVLPSEFEVLMINIQTSLQQQQQLNKLFNSCLLLSFLALQGRVDVKFQNKVKTLIHIITENRNRLASGPVHSLPSIPLHVYYFLFFKFVH